MQLAALPVRSRNPRLTQHALPTDCICGRQRVPPTGVQLCVLVHAVPVTCRDLAEVPCAPINHPPAAPHDAQARTFLELSDYLLSIPELPEATRRAWEAFL
jgi:hypothetical protein